MPNFRATYTPNGIDIHSGTPDPRGSNYTEFSAPSYTEAVKRALVDNQDGFRLRRVIRVDGSRETTIYEITVREGERPDGEDFMFSLLKCPRTRASA